MSFLNSATNLIQTASEAVAVVTGVASAASNIIGRLTGAESMVQRVDGLRIPMPNPLFAYASYDYVLGISAMTDWDLNNPDKSYRVGKRLPLICKSANMDPSNRVNTPYGKFDFFIENLIINNNIGLEANNNTNVTGISFDVTEPYSMGLFPVACQEAAWLAKHANWRSAPFLLTIDFRGNTEQGKMSKISGTSRQIPFKFQEITATVKETGTVYHCTAMPYNQLAFATKNSVLKTDTSASGATVQEVLQTGDKSLQAVLNKRLQQLKTDGLVPFPDEIVIIFPNDYASGKPGDAESKNTATTSAGEGPADEILKKIGVTRAPNKSLIQASSDCNPLGTALMGFDQKRKGNAPMGKDNQVYDPNLKINVRADNTAPQGTVDFKFSQDTDIPNAINQVLLQSQFAIDTLGADRLSPEGWRKWWRIDAQVYNITTGANNASTGEKPKIIVYRVLPYKVHASTAAPPNTKVQGFKKLQQEVIKEYNYIYTGKNVDVLKFEIELRNTFTTMLAADGGNRNADVQQAGAEGGTEPKKPDPDIAPAANGSNPEIKLGVTPTTTTYGATKTSTDKKGGAGPDTEGTRAARSFHDAVTYGKDMVELNMEIIGDPYYIAQSGMGNYTSRITQFNNLNSDGTINYQDGEVDIMVNFRTPVDLNQSTGMYNFSKNNKTAPVLQFSGLYRITNVTSTFRDGTFKQVLIGQRRPMQEATKTAAASQTFNTTTPPKQATVDANGKVTSAGDANAWGEG